eukprot:CCRYP_018392-RA/>CCRYP_018392-RA protein AED:0.39 eAED:0.39 QI:0/0/0/1/0/0.5/2/0/263
MSNTAAAHLNATQLANLTRLSKIIQPTSTDKSPVPPTLNTTHISQPKRNTAHPIVSDSDSDMSPQSSDSTPLRPLYTPGQPVVRSPRVTPNPPQMNNTASPRHQHTTPVVACNPSLKNDTAFFPAPGTNLFPTDFLNAILNEETGELMEYRHLIKDPKYTTIWRKAYGKELGRLAQGIQRKSKAQTQLCSSRKTTYPLINAETSPTVAYAQIFDQNKMTCIEYVSPSVATESISPATAAHLQPTCSQQRSSLTASFQPKGHDS